MLYLHSGDIQVLDTPSQSTANTVPIVVLHGRLGSINWWNDILPALRLYHRVLAIDLLGHGGSQKPHARSDYTIRRHVNLVAQALEHEGIKRAILVGHSTGALVATALLEANPDMVDRLVIIGQAPNQTQDNRETSAGCFNLRDWLPVIDQTKNKLAKYSDGVARRRLAPLFAPGFFIPSNLVDDSKQISYVAQQAFAQEEYSYLTQRSLVSRLRRAREHQITGLLVLLGEHDPIFYRHRAAETYDQLDDTSLKIIPGAGNAPHVESPEHTARAIGEFIHPNGVVALPDR